MCFYRWIRSSFHLKSILWLYSESIASRVTPSCSMSPLDSFLQFWVLIYREEWTVQRPPRRAQRVVTALGIVPVQSSFICLWNSHALSVCWFEGTVLAVGDSLVLMRLCSREWRSCVHSSVQGFSVWAACLCVQYTAQSLRKE